MVEEIESIIANLDAARAAMQTIIPKINREWEIYPKWTLKHILAHITGWDEAATLSLEAHLRGDEAMIPAYRGVNEYNEESVRTRAELTYELIAREYEYQRERLKATMRRYTAEQWATNLLLPWGGYAPPADLIRVWERHEKDHAAELTELAERKGVILSPKDQL